MNYTKNNKLLDENNKLCARYITLLEGNINFLKRYTKLLQKIIWNIDYQVDYFSIMKLN